MAQIDDNLRGSTRYQYDAAQRLTQVQGPNPEVFIHGPAGNLLADSAATPQGQQAYGNRSQQARGKQGALKTHYQYNALNQLTAIAVNGVITQYTYDPLGRRIIKRSADKSCEFLWLGDQLLAEKLIDPTGAQLCVKTYIFKPNSFEPIAFVQNDGIYYYHHDHLGTPQEITNQNGELVWAVSYKAYGNLAVAFKTEVENNLRFAGQYFDEESGLHYNRFRYYDPVCGRFINQDPIGLLGGVNNYLYVPNPTGWVDPLGLSCKNEGVARIHHHEPTPQNEFGHYSVEIISKDRSMHTHQVITAKDRSATTILDHRDYPASTPIIKTVEIPLRIAESAIDYQRSMEFSELGAYDKAKNSCVTHVCETLRQGGADVPESALGSFKYLKKLGF